MTALPTRRVVLLGAAALAIPTMAWPTPAHASRRARVALLIRDFIGGAVVREGGFQLDLPELVDNGNAAPMIITLDAPAGMAREIAVFSDGNPLPEVLRLSLGPAAGPLRLSTRIRLADSQTVTALARLADGTCRRAEVGVLVTLAACIE